MLHEILLSLSGHPSPLFDSKDSSATDRSIDFPLLSPPEQALLQSIGKLSHLHRNLRDHAARISSSHPSTIARAVATAISTVHLARFQNKILEVEAKILRRDSGSVGAYNVVPLAGVVGEFDGWRRRLDWYWQLVCFMQHERTKSASEDTTACSGAALIDKLRQEAQTGYPDIEVVALELGKVAETAWLRQLSGWVLYGRLPLVGGQDFFVQNIESDESQEVEYDIHNLLLPRYVSGDTAASILFIGKSLNTIRIRGKIQARGSKPMTELDLVPIHLQHLAKLVFPLSSASLSSAINEIRLSLSRNTLQQLLPLPSILQILSVLRDFFLLKRGEFAVALINEADACLRTRNQNPKVVDNLRGMLVKEAELIAILTKTFATLSSSTDDDNDTIIDYARSLLSLQSVRPTSNRPATPGRAKAVENLPQLSPIVFNDLLLPMPTTLTMDIVAPFDLFLSPAEVNIYSSIQAYILSIRRAHLRLSSLWRETSIRKTHPAPPINTGPRIAQQLKSKRTRAAKRGLEMRAMWATSSAAVFLLGEVASYFEGEVIDEAWGYLHLWITQTSPSRPGSSHSRPASSWANAGSSPRRPTTANTDLSSSLHNLSIGSDAYHQARPSAPHDPAVLSSAHRSFLSSLARGLLLTNISFTTALRDMIRNVDALVALVVRLRSIQESLDLEEDEGVVDPMGDFAKQEEEVKRELSRARKRVDAGTRAVVEKLRAIDSDTGDADADEDARGDAAFVPYRGAGVERLLMRIEGGRKVDDDDDEQLIPDV
jgi:hypothetical protein